MYKVKKIKDIFQNNDKSYILFILENNSNEFLYSINLDASYYSLFFGKDLEENISVKMMENVECLECSIGVKINGGVCYDNGDITDFNFEIPKANKIINELRRVLIGINKTELVDKLKIFK